MPPHRRINVLWRDDDPQANAIRYSTSWAFSPLVLGLIRAAISLYAFTTLFTTIGFEVANGVAIAAAIEFVYMTILNYWALAFYFAFAAAHSLSYHASGGTSFLQRWSKWLIFAHGGLYATITVLPFIVTIVFWTVLGGSNALTYPFAVWNNISEHALNSAFALFEIFMTSTNPTGWNKLLVIIIVLALYLAETYVFYAASGGYVYPFLNPNNGQGLIAVTVVVILVASILIFVIVRYTIMTRRWLTEIHWNRPSPTPLRQAAFKSNNGGAVNNVSTS